MIRTLALGVMLLFGVACIGFGQQLSGSWDCDVDLDPQQTSSSYALGGFYSTLKINYSVSDWTFASYSVFDETGWIDQDFSVTGVLGPVTLTGAVDFNPVDASFGSLVCTTSVPYAGAVLGTQFRLQGEDTFLTLTASGSAGDLNINITVNLGDDDGVCDFPFEKTTITVRFPFSCATVVSSLVIGCDGFDVMTFSTSGIAIPFIPWLTINAQLAYTLTTKTLTLSPVFGLVRTTCFDIYMQVSQTGNLSLDDFSLQGVKLTTNMGAVTFTGISFWGDGSKPTPLTGTDYWQVYTIRTNADVCCGSSSFDASVFFLEDGPGLFDASLFEANLKLTITSRVAFSIGMEMDLESHTMPAWSLGLAVTW